MQVEEFSLQTKDSNLAKIVLEGRYPYQGFAMNTVSEMTVYILEGSVVLHRGDSEDEYLKGMAVVIPKGQKYYWESKGEVLLLIFSTPPWSSQQQVLSSI